MIVVQLVGGLGNQMFQYAAGRALAARRGVPLALDRRWFAGGASRGYALHGFAISAEDADPDLLPMREGKILGRLLSRFGGRLAIYREESLAFDSAVTALPDGTYLRGNFPSERYFADREPLIRSEFTFVGEPDPANAALLAEIAGTNAVSLHVRRGDYVANPKIAKVHGTVDLGFYARAAAHIAERVPDPTIFVFSDDPAWARANLALPHPTRIVDLNGPDRPVADMRLMAACRHHILANSTFSWWGAWLNPSPDKIVVAPEPWFRDSGLDSRDIVPERWVRLPG